VLVGVGGLVASLALTGAASASSTATYNGPYTYCVGASASNAHNVEIFQGTGVSCAAFDYGTLNNMGVVTSSTQLVSAPESVVSGGSFSTNKTLAGTITLSAGTYLVDVNFKATPNAVTTGQVFPSLFVYNGPQASGSFANDIFNVGSGGLELPTAAEVSGGDLIDSYFSGTAEITVPAAGETLDVYAFGYDSDAGAGTYELDSAVVTVTHLNVSS
jgi:hypothetical protein